MWISISLLLHSVIISSVAPGLLAKALHEDSSSVTFYPLVYLRRTAGGLGNQLFQYACSYSISKKLGIPFNIHVPEDIIAATNNSASSNLGSLNSHIRKHYTNTKDRTFALQFFPNIHLNCSSEVDNYVLNHEESVISLDDRTILKGNYPVQRILSVDSYCQSEKYFSPYQDDIRHMYSLNVTTDNVKKWNEKINSVKESVAVHIRKGDFDRDIHRRIGIQYYLQAMKFIAKKLHTRNPHSQLTFFVFSDDIEAVKSDFSKYKIVRWKNNSIPNNKDFQLASAILDRKEYQMYWVSSTETSTKLSNIEEFYLMTRCANNIVSTSTFGWWTAYLNPNPDKIVIAAKHNPLMYIGDYFHDEQFMNWYYPTNWTVLDVKYDWS